METVQGQRQIFEELERRLAALEPSRPEFSRDRWVVAGMSIGVVMTLPSIWGLKSEWSTWLALGGIPLELCALAVFMFRQMKDVVPDFIDAKRKFALELDIHFVEYEAIRSWLASLDRQAINRRLGYVESRLDSMGQRYPLVFGSVDKLGVLPVLIGLFFQVRAITALSLATGVLGIMIVALYLMALWMSRFRLQLQGYARLLRSVSAS